MLVTAIIWGVTIWTGGAAIVSAILTGSSNLTVGLSVTATLLAILGLIADATPHNEQRR